LDQVVLEQEVSDQAVLGQERVVLDQVVLEQEVSDQAVLGQERVVLDQEVLGQEVSGQVVLGQELVLDQGAKDLETENFLNLVSKDYTDKTMRQAIFKHSSCRCRHLFDEKKK